MTTHTTTTTPNAGRAYTLPEAQRQAILGGSDSARCSAFLHTQRKEFMSKNHGCEFGQDYEEAAEK